MLDRVLSLQQAASSTIHKHSETHIQARTWARAANVRKRSRALSLSSGKSEQDQELLCHRLLQNLHLFCFYVFLIHRFIQIWNMCRNTRHGNRQDG